MEHETTGDLGVGSNALLGAIVMADEYSSQWPRCLRIVSLRMDDAELLFDEVKRLRGALIELAALVRGECPSLLNEDSGGCARLSMEIDELLKPNAQAHRKTGQEPNHE